MGILIAIGVVACVFLFLRELVRLAVELVKVAWYTIVFIFEVFALPYRIWQGFHRPTVPPPQTPAEREVDDAYLHGVIAGKGRR